MSEVYANATEKREDAHDFSVSLLTRANRVGMLLPMSSLTQDQVRHIAKLARLTLTDDQAERFSKELSSILNYIEQLQEVDTENVEPLAHVTGMTNSFRADEVRQSAADSDSLLETSPLPIIEHQIQTDSAHG